MPKNFKMLPLQKRLEHSANDHSTSISAQIQTTQDEVIDLDDDGVDEEEEEDLEEEVEELNVEEKEPSRMRLRALQAIAKMLVKYPSVDQQVSGLYVNVDDPTGNHGFTRRIAPQTSGSINSLALSATGIYEYIYDEKRKKKRHKPADQKWLDKFRESGLSRIEVERMSVEIAATVGCEEVEVRGLRRKVKNKMDKQVAETLKVKRQEQARAVRKEVREVRKELAPLEEALRKHRQLQYHYYNLLAASKSESSSSSKGCSSSVPGSSSRGNIQFSTPDLKHPAITDFVQNINITQLRTEASNNNKLLMFAGTDYGMKIGTDPYESISAIALKADHDYTHQHNSKISC
ncbi:hypothetical protein BGZ65_005447 [Modicella reniformis]|uniref:Uncharacterized protein n=1 Tax=Modicella reniformis TaxID=1440133 RepID=A0A9P6IXC1_9FUNG|nr:hypothetical protein BGZ65_005447 [Modicella reniformis]